MSNSFSIVISVKPGVVRLRTCNRYGPSSISVYQVNLQVMFEMFKRILQPDTLFIWTTTMPISEKVTGGVILKNISFLSSVLRVDVLMANNYATRLAAKNGFDVLDLHYYFRRKLHHRMPDGIHWDSAAHRVISNMLLRHVCSAWKIPAPIYWPRCQKVDADVIERIKWKTREKGSEDGGQSVTIRQEAASRKAQYGYSTGLIPQQPLSNFTQDQRRISVSSSDKSTTLSGISGSVVQSGGLKLRYRPY